MKPRVNRVVHGPKLVVVPDTKSERLDIYIKTHAAHRHTHYLTTVDGVWFYPEGEGDG